MKMFKTGASAWGSAVALHLVLNRCNFWARFVEVSVFNLNTPVPFAFKICSIHKLLLSFKSAAWRFKNYALRVELSWCTIKITDAHLRIIFTTYFDHSFRFVIFFYLDFSVVSISLFNLSFFSSLSLYLFLFDYSWNKIFEFTSITGSWRKISGSVTLEAPETSGVMPLYSRVNKNRLFLGFFTTSSANWFLTFDFRKVRILKRKRQMSF